MPDWLQTALFPLGLLGVIEIFLWILAGRMGRKLDHGPRKRLVFWLRLGLGALFLGAAFTLVGQALSPSVKNTWDDAWKFFSQPLMASGNTRMTLWTLLWVVPVLYAAAKAGSWTKVLTERILVGRKGFPASRVFGLANFLRYLVMIVTGLFGMGLLGLDLTSVGLFFSVLGVGLGFGLQDVVKNFFAGLVIIFSQPLKEGDLISVGATMGRVERLRLLSTVISTGGGDALIVPNADLVYTPVRNHSFRNLEALVWTPLSVAHGTDLEALYRILRETAAENPHRKQDSDILVQTTALRDTGIQVELGIWAGDVSQKRALVSWNYERLLSRLPAHGIQFPPAALAWKQDPG